MNNIQIQVMGQYNQLSLAEQKVANYFISHMDEIYSLPIADLAERSAVSAGTWVRFCKSIGFSGLKELKQALFDYASEGKKDAGDSQFVFADIKDHKDTAGIVDSIRASSVQAIENTLRILDLGVLEATAKLIMESKSVKLFGVGASSLVARDLTRKLMRIGVNAIFTDDFHVQLTIAATMEPDDLAIIVSNSGTTKEMLEIQEMICHKKIKHAVITSIGKNPLSQKADLILSTSSPEIHLRSGAMSSRIAQLIVVDCLFTTVANKNYQKIEPKLEESYAVSVPHKQTV